MHPAPWLDLEFMTAVVERTWQGGGSEGLLRDAMRHDGFEWGSCSLVFSLWFYLVLTLMTDPSRLLSKKSRSELISIVRFLWISRSTPPFTLLALASSLRVY